MGSRWILLQIQDDRRWSEWQEARGTQSPSDWGAPLSATACGALISCILLGFDVADSSPSYPQRDLHVTKDAGWQGDATSHSAGARYNNLTMYAGGRTSSTARAMTPWSLHHSEIGRSSRCLPSRPLRSPTCFKLAAVKRLQLWPRNCLCGHTTPCPPLTICGCVQG